MQPTSERERGEGVGEGGLREGEWFFKRKPTLASLLPHLGAVEYLNLSPSLTPSAVKMRDDLGCPLCLPLILFPFLPFEAFLLKFKITLVCLLFSPLLCNMHICACLFHSSVSAFVAYVYLWVFACRMVDNNSSYYHLQT